MAWFETARALRACRVDATGWASLADGGTPLLGGLAQGLAAPGADAMPARVLSVGGGRVDAWIAGAPVGEGCSGAVRWRTDGHWMWGALDLGEPDDGAGLESVAREAYRDIFDVLGAHAGLRLVRLWNYLPRINDDSAGLERYRQFNAGRQQAFLEAGAAAFEGAPAACAVGVGDGPLRVRFLAARAAALPIENPRQVSAYRYPPDYGLRSPSFSRAAVVPAGDGRVALLVSGTASIVGHATLHAGDAVAQTRETIANLRAVVGAANARSGARFALEDLDVTVFVRRAADLDAIRGVFEDAVGATSGAAMSAVFLEADICRADLLVEIEAHGFARAGTSA